MGSGKGAKGGGGRANSAKSNSPATVAPAKPVDPSRPIGVWLCLRCGVQLCDSNSTANHLAAHWAVPRSDLHCIAVNVTAASSEDGGGEASWEIWCSECNAEVYVDTYKKLREAVDYVRRVEANKGRASSATAATNTNTSKSTSQKPSSKSGSK